MFSLRRERETWMIGTFLPSWVCSRKRKIYPARIHADGNFGGGLEAGLKPPRALPRPAPKGAKGPAEGGGRVDFWEGTGKTYRSGPGYRISAQPEPSRLKNRLVPAALPTVFRWSGIDAIPLRTRTTVNNPRRIIDTLHFSLYLFIH